jgi:hypothetical protein
VLWADAGRRFRMPMRRIAMIAAIDVPVFVIE